MSNLRRRDTGIDGVVVWVSSGEFGGDDSKHGPRIEVSRGAEVTSESRRNAVSVTIANPPEFLGELPSDTEQHVALFVTTNREVLLRYWHGEISTREVLDLIQKV
ncbi:MAG: hypothetical protein ACHREM_23460 [Polyangiales bacterium]